MCMADVELHEAKTLDEAAALMARLGSDARLLAGGTDVFVEMRSGRLTTKNFVAIGRIAELRGISERDGGVRIGAMTTITEVNRSALIRDRAGAILDASRKMAAPQIRNMATVGGNIVSAVPCADMPPILMVMRSTVVLWSASGERVVPIESFFVDVRQTDVQVGEILTAVDVPAQPGGFGAAFERFALREGNAISVAGVAASLQLDESGVVSDARLALAAVAPIPKLAVKAAELLIGRPPDDESFERAGRAAMAAAEPICDVRGTADFRRELVGVLTKRALHIALGRAKETGA